MLVFFKSLLLITVCAVGLLLLKRAGEYIWSAYESNTLFEIAEDEQTRKCTKCGNKQRRFEGYQGVTWNTFKKNPNCACRKYVDA